MNLSHVKSNKTYIFPLKYFLKCILTGKNKWNVDICFYYRVVFVLKVITVLFSQSLSFFRHVILFHSQVVAVGVNCTFPLYVKVCAQDYSTIANFVVPC